MADWVLTVDVVRRSIARLREQSIHEHFPAYLYLRQQAGRQGKTSGLVANWMSELSALLQVADAPSSHPHFRPFTQGTTASDQEWRSKNLSGSFSPASVRAGRALSSVIEAVDAEQGPRYTLKEEHWKLAREFLVKDEKVPLWAVAGFMLRDYALERFEVEPGYPELETEFLTMFGYVIKEDEGEIDYLYDRTPPHNVVHWFEEHLAAA